MFLSLFHLSLLKDFLSQTRTCVHNSLQDPFLTLELTLLVFTHRRHSVHAGADMGTGRDNPVISSLELGSTIARASAELFNLSENEPPLPQMASLAWQPHARWGGGLWRSLQDRGSCRGWGGWRRGAQAGQSFRAAALPGPGVMGSSSTLSKALSE